MATGNGYIGTYRGVEVYVIKMERYFEMDEDLRMDNSTMWALAENGSLFYMGKYFGKIDTQRNSIREADPHMKNLSWKDALQEAYCAWKRKKTEPKARVAEPTVVSERPKVEAIATGAEKLEALAGLGKESLDKVAGYAAQRISQLMKEAAAHRR